MVLIFSDVALQNCDLLGLHFEELCKASNDYPPDFGSPGHLQRTVEGLPDAVYPRMVNKVKWTRWGVPSLGVEGIHTDQTSQSVRGGCVQNSRAGGQAHF